MEWKISGSIPLYKSGDINNPSNYHTIMVNPLLGKLFWSIESTLGYKNGVKKQKGKLVLGQGTLPLSISSLIGTPSKRFGTSRVRRPCVDSKIF